MAATLAAHPEIGGKISAEAHAASRAVADRLWHPVLARARRVDEAFLDLLNPPARMQIAIAPPGPNDLRTLVRPRTLLLPARALNPASIAPPEFAASQSVTILPDLTPEPLPAPPEPRMLKPSTPHVSMPDIRIAREASKPDVVLPAPPLLKSSLAPDARAAAVTARLRISLTPEMMQSFDLFLYVSKADHGPLAQRMYVFEKRPGNILKLAYDWPASTGREKQERNPRGHATLTDTPRGYYELDPHRMYRRYRSYTWDQPMPNAMFFNWEREGLQTGLAIHAASGDDIARLGSRASAGCVHLSPENARTLYDLIHAGYRGDVPRFAYNERTQTMSNDGSFLHDANGNLKMQGGYKVLTFIEDFGGDNSVAALF